MHGVCAAGVVSLDWNNQDMHGSEHGAVHILLLQKMLLHAIMRGKNLQEGGMNNAV